LICLPSQRACAIIFDFNGVIADDEAPHLLCFQQALEESGLSLNRDDYHRRCLGMDERTCAQSLLTWQFGWCDPSIHSRIMTRKADLFRLFTDGQKPVLFPGIIEFVTLAKRHYRLAIASGGRRNQIEAALRGTPIENDCVVIVSADDVQVGKPDPAIYEYECER
jgi:beta-phosphoglucomutase-like phosphatase (HAD superfamily)